MWVAGTAGSSSTGTSEVIAAMKQFLQGGQHARINNAADLTAEKGKWEFAGSIIFCFLPENGFCIPKLIWS